MKREKKYFGKYKPALSTMPNLVEAQLTSFKNFLDTGIEEVFKEFVQIKDYSEKKFELDFIGFKLTMPKYDEYYAKENKMSYEASIKAMVRFKNKPLNSVKEQEIFMADMPIMTPHGTFIIAGIERVIVPQLARSFGIFFTGNEVRGRKFFGAKIIPSRGAWVEIEAESDGGIYVRIDRKRKFPVSVLMRVLGATSNENIHHLFAGNEFAKFHLDKTLIKDHTKSADEAYIEIHKKLRDGDLATAENARQFIDSIFSAERYDLSKVGRFRFNKRFGMGVTDKDVERRTINLDDVVAIVNNIVKLNNTPGAIEDDIDHLGSRRVRYVGELMQQKLRVGMSQLYFTKATPSSY